MQVVRNYNQADKFSELFYYDESSPSCLVWKDHKTKVGMPVGRKLKVRGKEKYWVVDIAKECYVIHRIIWVMHNGNNSVLDGDDIDHINQNGLDNKISNLRIAQKSTNSKNCKQRSDNSAGVTGVHEAKANGVVVGYKSETKVNGVKVTKQFNFSVHGIEGAFNKAVEHRKNMQKLDGNYTEFHGS